MSFRLVPNSVTSDDLERRNSLKRSVISLNSVAFLADYARVVEDTPIFFPQKFREKNIVFSDVSLIAISAGITPSESVKVRHFSSC